MSGHLTTIARSIPDRELAAAVARQRLTSRLTDYPVAPLADCVRMGRAVGLTMSEMQRSTGIARQTLYRYAPAEDETVRSPAGSQAIIEVLMLLAADGDHVSPAVLARRGALDPRLVMRIVTDLDMDGLCEVRKDDYASLEAAPTEATFVALREHFDDLYLRRPDAIAVYVAVPEDVRDDVARHAPAVLAEHDHTVMAPSIAPSVMEGPELALAVNAPTIRRALMIARDVWGEILDEAEIPRFEPVIANVIPPGAMPLIASDVLDAFLEAIVDTGAAGGGGLREIRGRYAGGVPENRLAGRCVTMAALALRRAAGNEREPRTIVDSDTAFAEWQPARGVPVGADGAAVKEAAVQALDLATERLGPFPGGRLGSFAAPGQAPHVVEDIRPTGSELLEMARLSGAAVGAASAAGLLDVVDALQRVVSSGA